MLKELIRNGLVTGIAACALALAGCGQESGNGDGNGGAGDSAPAGNGAADTGDDASGADAENGAGDADQNGADPGEAAGVGSTEFNDATAEGAIMTYVNRLKSGDILGAAEICVEEAPGTDALIKLGTNIEKMQSEPENASMAETARQLFIQDFRTMEVAKAAEEDGVAVYEVSVINKGSVNIRVERRDGVWRVIPPVNGTPVG